MLKQIQGGKKMKKEKEIVVKVVSQHGHDTFNLNPQLAFDRVKTETQEHGKWAYVDGDFKSADTLTLSDIEKAEEIVLTSALVGGSF